MFLLLAHVLASFIGAVMDWIFPHTTASGAHSLWSGLPHNLLGAIVNACAIFGLFVDLPVFFYCLGFLFSWRLIWLVYHVYRSIKDAIPFVG